MTLSSWKPGSRHVPRLETGVQRVERTALAWVRYGRLSSFRTHLSKEAGVLLGVYVVVLFVVGQQDWLLYVAALTSVAASFEELWLLALLPTWRADMPGVWWLRRTG